MADWDDAYGEGHAGGYEDGYSAGLADGREEAEATVNQRDDTQRALEYLEARFPCDGGCTPDSVEEQCSRHGRKPSELWGMLADVTAQRDRVQAVAVRHAYEHAAWIDSERGCVHNAEEIRAGMLDWDALPKDCDGPGVAEEWLIDIQAALEPVDPEPSLEGRS